jgi:hypothetical protein
VGTAAGIIVLAIVAIIVFKHQVGQSEEFKNRLNRGGSPPLPSLPYEKNVHLDKNQTYAAGYDLEYSYDSEPNNHQLGRQIEYGYEPEPNSQNFGEQFDYGYGAEPNNQHFGEQFEYRYEPEPNSQKYGGQF